MTPATEVTGGIDTPGIDHFRELVNRSFMERGDEPSHAMVDPRDDAAVPYLFRCPTVRQDEIRMSAGSYEQLNRELRRLPGNEIRALTQLWGVPIRIGGRV